MTPQIKLAQYSSRPVTQAEVASIIIDFIIMANVEKSTLRENVERIVTNELGKRCTLLTYNTVLNKLVECGSIYEDNNRYRYSHSDYSFGNVGNTHGSVTRTAPVQAVLADRYYTIHPNCSSVMYYDDEAFSWVTRSLFSFELDSQYIRDILAMF